MSVPGLTFFAGAGVPVLCLGLTYVAGARRRAYIARPVSVLRHASFGAGLGLLFFSLEWPFAEWAHELFYVHQIGIIVARIVAPILIALAHPAGLLIAGLPRSLREQFLKPGISELPVRAAWRLVRHPAVAVVLYIGTFYLWEIPAAQAAAIEFPAIGLFMHLSLLLTGLLFWTRVIERRPAPHGITHGKRLMMIWLAMLSQIALGVYLTVKTTVLYQAYAASERIAMIAPLDDESRGGFFVWYPSALLSLLTLIVVIDMWGRHETKMDAKRTTWSSSNSAILLYPTTARALREMTRVKNRRLAIGLATFSVLVFIAMCSFAIEAHRLNRRENMRLYAQLHR